jgi:hypothetical protein
LRHNPLFSLAFLKEGIDRQIAKVVESLVDIVMVPVPPGQGFEPLAAISREKRVFTGLAGTPATI